MTSYKPPLLILLGATGLAGSLAGPSAAQASETANPEELEAVLITAQRAERVSRGATGLDLDIKDTPQSISVVTEELMQDFGANSINDALRLATGINVEEWETNRTNYMARGFEIKSTQVDGVGLPNDWGIVTGALDAFGYEKLEVIRGANGLLTGVGNASGTINYVRKRPTNERRGQFSVDLGSWDGRRIEADYSTPLTASGSWAGRVVAAYDDRDSYLRSLQNDRLYLYGVIDGQVGERTTVAFGYSFQDADTSGNMWGALVFSRTDGSQAEFDRSASTTQDWTYWNTQNQTAFAEVTYALADRWSLKGTYNYRYAKEADKLFFAYSTVGLDPATNEGLIGWPGRYAGSNHAHMGDVSLSGRFTAFGQDHDLILGVTQSSSGNQLDAWEITDPGIAAGPLPAFPYAGDAIPEPVWGDRYDYNHYGQWLRRAYGATRLALGERVKVIAGFNAARFHRQGVSDTGAWWEQTQSEVSPYGGITVDITGQLLAYASYSDIYQPQDQRDIDGNYLDPSKGVNVELGLKAGWLEDRLLASAAWFSAKQKGLSTFAGYTEDFQYYYTGIDVDSKGFEVELVGKLNRYAELRFGFTKLKLENDAGDKVYEWVPRETVNLSLVSALPGLPLRVGVNARWQSRISKLDEYTSQVIHQDGYGVANVFGQWQALERMNVHLNVNNVTNKKYIGSLYQVGYYGAPRNYSVGVDYRF